MAETINYETVSIPKRKYGTSESFFADGLKLGLPSDKALIWTPVMNLPDQSYIDGGALVARNPGVSVADLPFDSRGIFINNAEYIKNANPNNPIANWIDRTPAVNAVKSFIQSRGGGYKIVTSGAQEAGESTSFYPWRQSANEFPIQYRWIEEEMSAQMGAFGGENYGPYDGHLNLLGITEDMNNVNTIMGGFSDPAQALNICKASTGFGNPYFLAEYWKIPNRHALLNTYFAGSMNPYQRLVYMVCMFVLHRMAEKATGVTKKLLSFEFSGYTEFAGDNIIHKQAVTGGTVENNGFPLHSFKYQVAKGLIEFLYCDRRFCWQDTYQYGTNPSIIGTEDEGFHYVGIGPITRMKRTTVYRVEGAPYVPGPQGYAEANLQGSRMYGLAAAHAGSQLWSYARYRPASSGGFNSAGATYVLDRFRDLKTIAWLLSNPNATKQALIVWPGYDDQVLDFDINRSSSLTLEIPGGVPSLFLIS